MSGLSREETRHAVARIRLGVYRKDDWIHYVLEDFYKNNDLFGRYSSTI